MEIDTAWFIRRIEGLDLSLRKIAPLIRGRSGKSLDVAAVSLMLRGLREISLSEARQLANILEVPMSEVIKRAGVPFGVRDNVERR